MRGFVEDKITMAKNLQIHLAIFDVDGVLTDGTKLYYEDGTVSKVFHDQDSYGLQLLKGNGVEVAIVSSDERVNSKWAEHQKLPFWRSDDKARTVKQLLDNYKCDLSQTSFMGDDLRDIEAMRLVPYSIAPANAVAEVRNVAKYFLQKAGGSGAVREAVELILRINGDDDT